MTVKELINKLQELPQDAEVRVFDGDDWVEPNEIEYGTFPIAPWGNDGTTWTGVAL